MGCPIVNTPFTRDSVCNTKPSLPRQSWNSAPSSDGRELPPYPRRYPEPWLGPLSFIARHTPVGPPYIVGRSAPPLAVARTERRTTCPSSDGSTRDQDGSCSKTGGIIVHRGRPKRRSHHPRACAPSRQQRYEVKIDGPMQFAFANPLRLPTSVGQSLLLAAPVFSWASHLAAGRVSDIPVKRRFGRGCGPHPTVVPSAS